MGIYFGYPSAPPPPNPPPLQLPPPPPPPRHNVASEEREGQLNVQMRIGISSAWDDQASSFSFFFFFFLAPLRGILDKGHLMCSLYTGRFVACSGFCFFFSATLKTSRTSVQSQFCFCFSPLEFSSAYESDSSAKLSLLSVLFEFFLT